MIKNILCFVIYCIISFVAVMTHFILVIMCLYCLAGAIVTTVHGVYVYTIIYLIGALVCLGIQQGMIKVGLK